jgi:hypothetical protein
MSNNNKPQAHWTGKSEHFLSLTKRASIRGEYLFAGQRFWREFIGTTSCPGRVDVE